MDFGYYILCNIIFIKDIYSGVFYTFQSFFIVTNEFHIGFYMLDEITCPERLSFGAFLVNKRSNQKCEKSCIEKGKR